MEISSPSNLLSEKKKMRQSYTDIDGLKMDISAEVSHRYSRATTMTQRKQSSNADYGNREGIGISKIW